MTRLNPFTKVNGEKKKKTHTHTLIERRTFTCSFCDLVFLSREEIHISAQHHLIPNYLEISIKLIKFNYVLGVYFIVWEIQTVLHQKHIIQVFFFVSEEREKPFMCFKCGLCTCWRQLRRRWRRRRWSMNRTRIHNKIIVI